MILGVDYDFGFSLLYFLKNLSKEKMEKNSSKQLWTDAEFPPQIPSSCVYFKRISFWTFISTINNTIVRRKFFNNSTRLDFGSRIKDFMGVERYLHLARRFAGFLSIHLI